jgi:PAS domain S-box-containing protein
VEQRFYNRLLLRLLGLPIIALAALAFVLGSGLQQVETSARNMDRSDMIIAKADVLFRLIIDEETGIRGYLLTHDASFLEPLRRADKEFDPDLEELVHMVRGNPEQVDRLRQLQRTHEQWEIESEREITDPPGSDDMEGLLLNRNGPMKMMRQDMTQFLQREHQTREERAAFFIEEGHRSESYMALLIGLIAILIAWVTQRAFVNLASVHRRQLNKIRESGRISFEREQWLNTTLRSIGDAVIACDVDGRVVFMNPVAEHLTGWSEGSARGRELHEIFSIFDETTREPVENPVSKVRRMQTIAGMSNHTLLVRRDGKEISIDDNGAPIRSTSGALIGVVMVFRDITDRKRSDEALMRAEKLAAAGRLAASVAHEVNNPLEGLTNLVYIARTTEDLTEVRALLLQAEQELGRIAHITRQSLGFYREITAKAMYKPGLVIEEVCTFYNTRALSMGVSLIVNAHTAAEVIGVAGEVRQVFSNLIANSLDASTRGARIRIDIRDAPDPCQLTRRGVRISIADCGSGIPPQYLKEIFEPFFTTKKDTGTGLGLWVSRQLVEKNGGTLRVRSSVNGVRRGTTFSIFLPCSGKLLDADGDAEAISYVITASPSSDGAMPLMGAEPSTI